MRIYTRTGDAGETGLLGGQRVPKNHPRVVAAGSVDELNAWLGRLAVDLAHPDLERLLQTLQQDLFVLGADLAAPLDPDGSTSPAVPRVREAQVAELERWIDALEGELQPLANFILPGGVEAAARAHIARAVCRRAERDCVALAGRESLNPEVGAYLNRLSDLLFVLARVLNQRAGTTEIPWKG